MSSDDLNRVMMDLGRTLDMTNDDMYCCPICGDHWVMIDDLVAECGKEDCGAKWGYIIKMIDYGKKNQVHEPDEKDEEKEVNRFELMEF